MTDPYIKSEETSGEQRHLRSRKSFQISGTFMLPWKRAEIALSGVGDILYLRSKYIQFFGSISAGHRERGVIFATWYRVRLVRIPKLPGLYWSTRESEIDCKSLMPSKVMLNQSNRLGPCRKLMVFISNNSLPMPQVFQLR